MSHLVKQMTVTVLAVFVLFSMCAFAQTHSKTTLTARADKAAKPAKMAAVPQHTAAKSSQNWMTHRFEISFQGGGVIGGNMGKSDFGKCVSAGSLGGGFTDGCNPNQNLDIENNDAIYEQNISGIRAFQRFGGIQPGNGGLWGLRFGFNINPRWEVEFIYNHVYSGTAFTNANIAQDRIALLNGGFQSSGGSPDHRLIYLDHAYGNARGEQNMYLFNINRNFNAGGRVVPYIGGGLGAVHWYAGPKLNVEVQSGGGSSNLQSTEITKYSRPDTGFAFDLAAGVKAYLTPSFGVRGDITQVWSFPGSLSSRSSTVDLSGVQFGTPGALFPISGTTSQSGKFSQTAFTGGVFWAFGGGWQNEHPNVGTFGNSNEDFWDHWELSWTFGGVHGRDLGQGKYRCTPGVTNGCGYNDVTLFSDLARGGTGVYAAQQLDELPQYLATGYTKPGDGWGTGLRLAYSFSPNWDVALVWNLSGTGSHFSNQNLFDTSLAEFYRSDGSAVPAKAATVLGGHDGHSSGTQSTYLINIDRNFHVSRRFVPYVGAGLGWVSWNGGPNTQERFDRSGANSPSVYDVFKKARNENAFAVDLGGGAKYYLTRHFGVRADVMDVFSFGSSRTDFGTVDTSGLFGTPGALVPVSGRLDGDAHYSQIVTQAGVFWSFGQGGTWKSDYSGSGSGRWDISLQAGGIVGGNLGQDDEPSCKSIATVGTINGCDMNQSLTHRENGILPGRIGGIRVFQRYGGIEPGNGGLYGFRLGYSVTPAWQLEFIWNHASTGTSLTNSEMINPSLISQNTGRDFDHRDGTYINDGTGKPQGNQNMYLVNLNRKFNLAGRVVPYVGFGGGLESWYAGPKLNFFFSNNEPNNNAPQGTLGKFSSGKNAFAVDFATGAKMYVGRNYGFRADFTDVMSFADFTTTAITNGTGAIDFPADTGLFPVSARLKQSGRFNQAIFSGGVFWDIGGRSTTNGYTAPTGDRDSLNDKWEFGINFGGSHGAPWGTDTASCTAAISGGCDFTNTSLTHNSGGPYPGVLLRGQIPETLVEGGLKPGDGWMTGFQIGYNWTQNWQIAFIYNILGTGTRFDNHAALENGLVAFYSGCDCREASGARALIFDSKSDGRAQGIQHQFLVNLNRNFHVNSRIVPYFGAGLGGEIWAHNPEIGILVNTESRNTVLGNQSLLLAKKYSSQTGLAVDLTGGVKFYVSRHWGFKAEAMNVTSFQEFGGHFGSLDVNGFMGTPGALVGVAGTNKQSTRFNQTTGSGGLFWTF